MRLIKMLGLAALAALAAMAFVGASTAMAEEDTAVCSMLEEPCAPENEVVWAEFHLTAGSIWLLNTNETDVLCLKVLALVDFGELAEAPKPLDALLLLLTFSECGTQGFGGSHSNCTVTSNINHKLPALADLLKTALNLGTFTNLKTEAHLPEIQILCHIFGFTKIECNYDLDGVQFHVEGANLAGTAGAGMINTAGTKLTKLTGGSLCPETSEISSGLLEPLEDIYIVS